MSLIYLVGPESKEMFRDNQEKSKSCRLQLSRPGTMEEKYVSYNSDSNGLQHYGWLYKKKKVKKLLCGDTQREVNKHYLFIYLFIYFIQGITM